MRKLCWRLERGLSRSLERLREYREEESAEGEGTSMEMERDPEAKESESECHFGSSNNSSSSCIHSRGNETFDFSIEWF